MKPFNVKIKVKAAEITLTILPTDHDYFKIVYYGGILGAIHYHKTTKIWSLVPEDEVIAGDLPPYSNDLDENRVEIALDSNIIVKIGREIQKSHTF